MATKISSEDVLHGDLNDTKVAYETFEVIVRRDKLSRPSTQYIIMAKAIDDAGNVAQQVSNKARFCNDCIRVFSGKGYSIQQGTYINFETMGCATACQYIS